MKTMTLALYLISFPLFLSAQAEAARPLPFQINSGYDESWPAISPEGHALFFSRLGHPHNMGETDENDIWAAYLNPNRQWAKAVNLGAPANSQEGEVVAGISATGRRLYLYQPSTGRLSFTERNGRAWSPRQPLLTENAGFNGTQAFFHFHLDGRIMLVAMDGPESIGEHDLYVSFADEAGQWGPLRHLGPRINSEAEELGVFLAADGKTLYFSSGRLGGEGGQDLYCSRRLDDSWTNWSTPENLGKGINTPDDDVFFSMPAVGNLVYQVRQTPDGQTDLFEAPLPEAFQPGPVTLLTGQVKDAVSGKALAVPIRPYGPGNQQNEEWPDRQGVFQLVFPSGQPINLMAEMPGYFSIIQPTGPEAQPDEPLDYDNPVLLASINNDLEYQRRNTEIQQLQLHVRALDEELLSLKQEREAYRKALARRPDSLHSWDQFSDPEIDALRHRFEQYQRTNRDTFPSPIPDSYSDQLSSEQELESLKARYRRYQEYQAGQQEKEQAQKEASTMLWEKAQGFEDFQEDVEEGLAESLTPSVRQELSDKMLDEVKQEVALSLSQRERRQLELKEEAMRQEIRKSFSMASSDSDSWAKKGDQPEAEWERKLRSDLRVVMEPEVRAVLEDELREDIRTALRANLTYWAKKETQAELQAELDQKLQLQIETERRRTLPSPANVDAVAPLPPPTPSGYREVQQNLLLVPAKIGQVIPLNNVNFEPNKSTLQPEAYPELNRVVAFLQQNPGLEVEVAAHTGGQLSHSSALGLSMQRAKAIANFLIGNGVDEQRIVHKGYGKAFPITDNDTPEGQRMNQRIELRIIGQQSTTNNQ